MLAYSFNLKANKIKQMYTILLFRRETGFKHSNFPKVDVPFLTKTTLIYAAFGFFLCHAHGQIRFIELN